MRSTGRWAALAVVLTTVVAAAPAEHKIVLREQLGVAWSRELVAFPFEPEQGTCVAASVRLTGPDGPVPVQLIDVEHWPGGGGERFVKRASLAFVTDLPPLATRTYTVHYGPQAGTPPSLPSDLRIQPETGHVEITTSRFGVRLLLGSKSYRAATSAKKVPGPLLKLMAPDRTWYGDSRVYGPGRIVRYEARLLEKGPVVALVRIAYTYADRRRMELTVQVAAGGGHALWDMSVTPYDPETAARLTAGVGWNEAKVKAARAAPKDGFDLALSPGLKDLRLKVRPFPPSGTAGMQARWGGLKRDRYRNPLPDPVVVDIGAEPPGELIRLMPWAGWWNQVDMTSFVFGTADREDLLFVATRDGGRWIEPAPPGTWASYGNLTQRHKWMPLVRGKDGSVYLRVSAAPGVRRWQTGAVETGKWLNPFAYDMSTYVIPRGMWPLDRVKDLVLDWPGDEGSHPRVFIDKDDLKRVQARKVPAERIQKLRDYVKVYGYVGHPGYRDPDALLLWLLTGKRALAEEAKLLQRLRTYLGKLGRLDRMRQASQLACIYDVLIDSGLAGPRDRKLFRAQMAFVGYVCADPGNWSLERGFASGNQNMSVAHILNQGMIAATLPEHPMARAWSEPALRMMEKWLAQSVGPKGQWPESLANYAEVSVSMLCVYAVAAKNARIHDFTADPRFQKMMLYLAKHYTPPDPRPFKGRTQPVAVSPPSGRGPAYHPVTGMFGLVAKATAESDPAFSQVMQWLWIRGGQSSGYLSDRMSGLERVCMDPGLPTRVPAWGSEPFPGMDVLLRQGVGTPLEYYANFVMAPTGRPPYYSENGGFAAIWAKGVPTTVRFAGKGYAEREEIFTSRVLLARQPGEVAGRKKRFMYVGPMKVSGFSALPRQDYIVADMRLAKPKALWHSPEAQTHVLKLPAWPPVAREGKPPVDWKRQVLFIKGASAGEPGYFLFRDTLSGGQPTMWQFWTLSEKIGTLTEVRDRAAFLADKPGPKHLDARRLTGDRFTAVGQLSVDVEYYVALPTDTPRHTLRWGHTYHDHYAEYQDMLHLQLPGDGAYFVAYYPRHRDEAVPAFTTMGEGKVISVRSRWGTDYGFLHATDVEAKADPVAFRGTAACVQDRAGGLVLCLGAAGRVRCREVVLEADRPVSLRVGKNALTVALPVDHPGTSLRLAAPEPWRLTRTAEGLSLLPHASGGYRLTVPAGVSSVTLDKTASP